MRFYHKVRQTIMMLLILQACLQNVMASPRMDEYIDQGQRQQPHKGVSLVSIASLPSDLLKVVFSFLNDKALLNAGRTCKEWHKIVDTIGIKTPLILSDKSLTDTDICLLARGPYRHASLINCSLTANHCKILAGSPLKTLHLDNNDLNDEAAEHLANGYTIEDLSLAGNNITDKGLIKLLHNTSIKTLNIGTNAITDEGLMEAHFNQTLISLNLSVNKITAKGAKVFENHPSIKHLDLYRNKITDDAADALVLRSAFDYLDLSRNALSETKQTEIKAYWDSNFKESAKKLEL